METITGTAAGVPFTALPPAGAIDGPAPLIVTWHMLDAPRTDAAFAAALPMTGLPAWRVHLGMPMCGARMVDGRLDAAIELAREDALLAFLAPFTRQAADGVPGRADRAARSASGRRRAGQRSRRLARRGRGAAGADRGGDAGQGGRAGQPGGADTVGRRARRGPRRTSVPVDRAVRRDRGRAGLRRPGRRTHGTTAAAAGQRGAGPPGSAHGRGRPGRCPARVTRTRTRSSWSPCRTWRTRWPRNRAWNRRRSCPRPGRSTRS